MPSELSGQAEYPFEIKKVSFILKFFKKTNPGETMESLSKHLHVNPLEIELKDFSLSEPKQTENGVSLNVKFRVSLIVTAKSVVIGAVGGGAIGGAGGAGFGYIADRPNIWKRAIQGLKLGAGIGGALGGLVGTKLSYDRVIETSARINNYVHPSKETSEYKAAKQKGIEILKQYFKDVLSIEDPDSFFCPITAELLKFPVKAKDKKVYEYEVIADWLKDHPNGITSSPFRVCAIDMETLEYAPIGIAIGKSVQKLMDKVKEISRMKQEDLNDHFREIFRGNSLRTEDINSIDIHKVVKKLKGRDELLTPTEITCLNVIVQPFIKFSKERHDAIYSTSTETLSKHLTERRISVAKHQELSLELGKWYEKTKIA